MIVQIFRQLWETTGKALLAGPGSSANNEGAARKRAQDIAPVVWLIGKAGAGKTSIIAALTGDARAKIGAGFEPCTRTASFYDVPKEVPLIRFLDTRGLEEPNYDPSGDIAWCENQSHLVLVVMQASDPLQHDVLQVVRQVRQRHAEWPVVIAQTGLHRLYPAGFAHPDPYPFTGDAQDLSNSQLPHGLRQALHYQHQLAADLPGARPTFVPIDFTLPEDGFLPNDYGIEALRNALVREGLAAYETLRQASSDEESDWIRSQARPLIYSYGVLAAGAGAVPIAMVGAGGLAGVLALMLRALALRYDVTWTKQTFAQFTGAIGGAQVLWWVLRYGMRELFKLVPVVGTATAGAFNAAAGFAVTTGIGEAACVWLRYRRRGETAPSDEIRRAFSDGLADGLRQAMKQSKVPEGHA